MTNYKIQREAVITFKVQPFKLYRNWRNEFSQEKTPEKITYLPSLLRWKKNLQNYFSSKDGPGEKLQTTKEK